MLVNESIMDTGESIPDVVRIQFHRIQYFSQTRVRAGVRVFPESGFSSGPSPSLSPSPVQVSKYAGLILLKGHWQ